MRANHNFVYSGNLTSNVVSNVSKILKWEQITTIEELLTISCCCFQCFKDTKMRANHNKRIEIRSRTYVVSNVSKILKWEQITTLFFLILWLRCCFQCFKDTKMRANHNININYIVGVNVVSNVSKILKWEQITTV